MTDAPRTLFNRLLLGAITFMSLAIVVLAALIIWKLFLAEEGEAPLAADARSFTVGSASVTYTVPEGCIDTSAIGQDSITITFTGETCAQREILSLSGNVKLQ